MDENPLGKQTYYPQRYEPALLVRIPRSENRRKLGLEEGRLPFFGADVWNAYELSCLDRNGKPVALLGRLIFMADSQFIIESKSMKLYLNSLNQEAFGSAAEFAETIRQDLSRATGNEVDVIVYSPESVAVTDQPAGVCLDDQDVRIRDYEVSSAILRPEMEAPFEELIEEVLYTNLFRSNCPITNQPDWATVTVCYRGRKMPRDLLLKYLVSYRLHNDYHENCVERIFCDLQDVYAPAALTVEANFLRRGGLDINPVRTTEQGLDYRAFPRYIRQ